EAAAAAAAASRESASSAASGTSAPDNELTVPTPVVNPNEITQPVPLARPQDRPAHDAEETTVLPSVRDADETA
ncbi:MAG TPA: hypothetical protein DD420_17580, partial [Streptomyces sp.]|nr:hypothetical protein [Streptomyces sp.]